MQFLKVPFAWLWHHKKISISILIVFALFFIFRPKPKPLVPTQKVTRGEFVQSLSVSGSVVAKKQVNLAWPIGGRIVWVGVKKGDTVVAGQSLASIDEQTAEKNLKAALISYSLQRDTFDQTQSDNQNRTPDQALNDNMKRILQDNQYNLDQAVNSVELQDLAKQQSVLWTPISGIVTAATTQTAGADAIAGTTFFTVTDPTSLAFDADVDQADIGKVSVGQPVQEVFDAFPNNTVTQPVSAIDFVSHTTTNGGVAFTVETLLPATTSNYYRVGMNANATIILSKTEDVLSVPLSAVVDNNYVYVKKQKGFIKKKLILGQENDTDAQVLQGLVAGDTIALDPQAAAAQAVK